jgi:long-chain acyl-CoA synthetase
MLLRHAFKLTGDDVYLSPPYHAAPLRWSAAMHVENLLTMHPKIFDVGVIGVPDPDIGEQVKAVVQLRDGVTPSDELADQLIAYVRDRLAHFKAPRSVDFVDELPRTPTGKLVKRTLQAPYVEART